VIALGKRDLPETMNYRKIQRMERTDSEKDLTFLGLIVMENRCESWSNPTTSEFTISTPALKAT
jgi:magnesium-transporting ATPase (P-type)